MTEINCKLCNEKIKFNINSPETYISKRESGNPMIGNLYTIRVAHSTGSEVRHINVVVIDQNGEYRAHKDYYKEGKDLEGDMDLWEKLIHQIPIEIRPFMSLASNDDKKILVSINQPHQKSIEEWHNAFTNLKNRNPQNELIKFIWVKWSFIIGKDKILLEENYKKNSWSYLIYLRLKARFSPSDDLIRDINEMEYQKSPLLIQLEEMVGRAEIYLRLGEMEHLESIFSDAKERWGNETTLELKSRFMIIQSYYSFGLTTLGKIKEAIELIEPAFNLGQVLEDREIICIAGNFYAAILQASGKLDKALKIYEIVLATSKELGDERTQAVVSTNISILESKKGLYDQALDRQKEIMELPIVQEEYFLKRSLQSTIGETFFIAERYDESIEMCKKIMREENVSTYYKSQALSTLKKIAGKTSSTELLEFVRNNLLEDEEFKNSPVGSIFDYDLKAIEAEINENWSRMIENLNKERKTMIKSKSLEDVSDIEIRLAQAYFKKYQETEGLEYLNLSYNHLDLAKTIALDNQNYRDLCKLTTLKGLLAIESELPQQAREHLNEALNLSQKHNLSNMEQKIINHLEKLDKGSIESSDSLLKKMFRVLTFRRSEEKKPPQKQSKVYSIYVDSMDNSWNIFLMNQKEGSDEHIEYLKGFSDLWNHLKEKIPSTQINYYNIRKGTILVENTENFQLIALCSNINYITRLSIQEILPELEEFSLKHIPDELSEKVVELVNEKFTNFISTE